MISLAAAQSMLDESPFGPWWGFTVTSMEPVTLELPLQPQMLRPGGFAQGGCAMTLADVTAWVCVVAHGRGEATAVTLHQDTTFLGPGHGVLSCQASIIKAGRSNTHVTATVSNARDGRLVSHHTVMYAHRSLVSG